MVKEHKPTALDKKHGKKGFFNLTIANPEESDQPKVADITLYDEISSYGVSAKEFRDKLQTLGEVNVINLHVHSPGGSVGDGLAIYNTLKSHPAKVHVKIDGWALSMASVVAMAGDDIEIADNGFMMIHNPMNLAVGDSEEMRFMAELLDKIKDQLVNTYAARTKCTAEEISDLMDAETWLSAAEACELGFADRCSGVLAVAASFDTERFNFKPPKFEGVKPMSVVQNQAADPPKPATMKELKAACPGADNDFLVAQLEGEATVPIAQMAWIAEQNKRLDTANAEAKAAKEAAEQGVAPVKTRPAASAAAGDDGAGDGATAIEQFNSLVSELMETKKMDRQTAIRNVVSKNPQLHKDFLMASNPNRQSKRLIEEKYE